MYFRIFLNILAIVFLSTIQISFISSLPGSLSNINIFAVALVFVLGVAGLDYAAWWAIGFGFFADLLTFSLFGSNMIVLLATVFVVWFLLNNFLTDRSLYVFLILTGLATVVFDFLINLFVVGFNFFSGREIHFYANSKFFQMEIDRLLLNLFLTFIIFYIFTFISHRFKPVFLSKNKK